MGDEKELSDFFADAERILEAFPKELAAFAKAVVLLDNAPKGVKLDGAYALIAAYGQNIIDNYKMSGGAKEVLTDYLNAIKEKSEYLRK
jgi:hypothetical protein